MLPDSSHDNSWEPCPAGELPVLVDRLRSRRRRQQAVRAASVAAAMVAVVAVAVIAFRRPAEGPADEFDFGGVACSEVQRDLPRYVRGELPDDVAERIRTHLAKCPACGPMYRMMLGEQVSQASTARAPHPLLVSARKRSNGGRHQRAGQRMVAAGRATAAEADVAYVLPGSHPDWRHVAMGR